MPEMASTIVRLSDEQREALTGYAAKAAWPSGFAIYQRDTPADGVFIVAQGRVELPVEANVTHHFQLEAGGVRSREQNVFVMTAEVKTLRPQ